MDTARTITAARRYSRIGLNLNYFEEEVMLWIRRLTMALATALAVSAAEAQISEFAAKVNDTGISRARLQASVDATINERGISYGGITQPDFFKRIQTQVLAGSAAQGLSG
ncbi:MAG: hypothetical protein OEQ39_16365 [Gammaproteobacteria bacterium]|nr:hypothetical protein [Gammaproteobacteria bacterium]